MDENLLALVSDGFREIRSKTVCHVKLRDAVAFLESLWNREPAVFGSYVREAYSEEALRLAASKQPYEKRPPPWYVGMTSGFRKAIIKVDRKLQKHIIEALDGIAENPTKLRGNTVQPLTGKLQGCWCCRLGPAQLIYFADQSSGDITLLAFASLDSSANASLKVLLLEDRDDFREILHEHMVSHSYQPTSVRSGVEGLREIMRSPFDLIISDMIMPRMGGEMFYQAVTRVRPAAGQRFIFFSGHKNNPAIDRFFQRVNAPVLYKPFNLAVLDAAISDVFRRLG
jgi:CheY-like chemotaxis protein/mRNA-degrading endonuclease RelE of RelBE toxin-antitoxin system